MLPVLTSLADGMATSLSEVRDRVTLAEGLTAKDIQERTPRGTQPTFSYNVSWATIYMTRAGLVERVRRGIYQITADGKQLLERSPGWIDMTTLAQYPSYTQWSRKPAPNPKTPEGVLARAVKQVTDDLEANVLQRILEAPPVFLEVVVVDLLIAMGYGRGDDAMGRVIGGIGDGGIDGTIREDALGLDEVYVQAKRYVADKPVGESALRNFAGAIDAAGTSKGVFVTTSGFTKAAKEYVSRSPKRIVLIDGHDLARLMVQYDVGVRVKEHYEVKRIDEDYFER